MFFDKHRFNEMFHVKHFAFIFILATCLFVNNIKVFGATKTMQNILSYNTTVAWIYSETYDTWYLFGAGGYLYQNENYIGAVDINQSNYITFYAYYNIVGDAPINEGILTYNNDYYGRSGLNVGVHQTPIVLKGTFLGDSMTWDEYEESQNPLWYQNIWNVFKGGFETGTNWIKTQIDNIGIIVTNWWYDITHGSHGGDHSFGNKYLTVNQATPTPIPTITPRPTPIPYSTVLQDDGNGNTTIMYQYNNPQGTPTASPYNPNQYTYYNTDINVTGGDRNNPIYVQDVGNVNFSELIDIANNSIEVNIGDLDDSTDMFTVPLEETAENVGDAISGFSALPDDLFIIIGCIACIPLIAGIIGRLLK